MDSIGKYLKSKREAAGLTIDEIANETRIKQYLIEYIENDDIKAFNDSGFYRNMVITYARTVSGNIDTIQKKLDSLFNKTIEKPVRITTAKNDKAVFLPVNLLWFIGLSILIIALSFMFYHLYSKGSLSFKTIKNQLINKTNKETKIVENVSKPESLFVYHRSLIEDNDNKENKIVENYDSFFDNKTIKNNKNYLQDKNDYIGQFLFDNNVNPLNPEY